MADEPTCLPDVLDVGPGRTELVAPPGCTLDGVVVRYRDGYLTIGPGVRGDAVVRLDRVDAHRVAVEVRDPGRGFPTPAVVRTLSAPSCGPDLCRPADRTGRFSRSPDLGTLVMLAVLAAVVVAVVTALRRRDRRRYGDG